MWDMMENEKASAPKACVRNAGLAPHSRRLFVLIAFNREHVSIGVNTDCDCYIASICCNPELTDTGTQPSGIMPYI
jgi:hypothetical protein